MKPAARGSDWASREGCRRTFGTRQRGFGKTSPSELVADFTDG
jgi:hypothetical protein